MKETSKAFLDNVLLQFKIESRDDIMELYKLYSAVEIDSYAGIADSTTDFFEYLQKNLRLNDDRRVKSAFESAQRMIGEMMNKLTFDSFEKKFAKTVLELSPTQTANAHILDVGPGSMPYSSLAMGVEAKRVSAMDKDFILTIESLKAMNVDAMENLFDENTSVDDYDFVVGRCPCSAIGHIVAQCSKANKPYFIELCNCNVPNRKTYLRDEHGNEIHTWKNVLPDIDPNVKFYEDYAFNLDASSEQVKRVVDKIHGQITRLDKFNVPAKKIYIPSLFVHEIEPKKQEWKPEVKTDEKPWEFDWD